MKKDVIILYDKGDVSYKSLEQKQKVIERQIEKTFPKKIFNVIALNHWMQRRYGWNSLNVWAETRLPIVIAIGTIPILDTMRIRNYSHRYFVSTNLSEIDSFDRKPDIKETAVDSYDEKNTYCFFGGDERDIEFAKQFEKLYPNTFYDTCNEYIDICGVIETIGVFDKLLTKGEMDNAQ